MSNDVLLAASILAKNLINDVLLAITLSKNLYKKYVATTEGFPFSWQRDDGINNSQ